MNRQEAEYLHQQICKHILKNQIGEGIQILEKFVVAAHLPGKLDELTEQKIIYKNMLIIPLKVYQILIEIIFFKKSNVH